VDGLIEEKNMEKETNKSFSVGVNFQYEPWDLADAVVHSRAVRAFDGALANYPIHRLVRCAARRKLEQVFDELALRAGLTAQRLNMGRLLMDGDGVFVQADGHQKGGYCSCVFNIWAESVARAEAMRDTMFRLVGDDRVRDQLFVVDWRVSGRDGATRSSSFEEMADDELLDEAYRCCACPSRSSPNAMCRRRSRC
jgi:hypothetical protein